MRKKRITKKGRPKRSKNISRKRTLRKKTSKKTSRKRMNRSIPKRKRTSRTSRKTRKNRRKYRMKGGVEQAEALVGRGDLGAAAAKYREAAADIARFAGQDLEDNAARIVAERSGQYLRRAMELEEQARNAWENRPQRGENIYVNKITREIWEVKTDPSSGKTYYTNHTTKGTQWDPPSYFPEQPPAVVGADPPVVAQPQPDPDVTRALERAAQAVAYDTAEADHTDAAVTAYREAAAWLTASSRQEEFAGKIAEYLARAGELQAAKEMEVELWMADEDIGDRITQVQKQVKAGIDELERHSRANPFAEVQPQQAAPTNMYEHEKTRFEADREKYSRLKVHQLKPICIKNGLPTSGKKEALIERLVDNSVRISIFGYLLSEHIMKEVLEMLPLDGDNPYTAVKVGPERYPVLNETHVRRLQDCYHEQGSDDPPIIWWDAQEGHAKWNNKKLNELINGVVQRRAKSDPAWANLLANKEFTISSDGQGKGRMMTYGNWPAGAFLPAQSVLTINSEWEGQGGGSTTVAKVITKKGLNKAQDETPGKNDRSFCKNVDEKVVAGNRRRDETAAFEALIQRFRGSILDPLDGMGQMDDPNEMLRTSHQLIGKIDRWKQTDKVDDDIANEIRRLFKYAEGLQNTLDGGVSDAAQRASMEARLAEIDDKMNAVIALFPVPSTEVPAPQQTSETTLVERALQQGDYETTPGTELTDHFAAFGGIKMRTRVVPIRGLGGDKEQFYGREGWVVGFRKGLAGQRQIMVVFIDSGKVSGPYAYMKHQVTIKS